MSAKKSNRKREGLDEEVEALRELIRNAVSMQTETTSLRDLTKLLDTVSKATLALSHSLKMKNELDQYEGTPATMMAEALRDLEEEWPEFKVLVQKHYPDEKKAENQ